MAGDSASSRSGFCTFSDLGTTMVFSTTTGVLTTSTVVLPVFLSVRVISYSSSSTTCFFTIFGLTGASIESSSSGATAYVAGATVTAGVDAEGTSSLAPEAAPMAADFGSTGAFSRSSSGAFTTGAGLAASGADTMVGATTTVGSTSYLAPEAAPIAADLGSTGAFSRSSSGAFTTGTGRAAGAATTAGVAAAAPGVFGITLFLTT